MFHHYQAHAPSWSVAVSTRCFQCSRSWAHLQAELRPWLWGRRSASKVRSHVWRGHPGGRFQSVGRPRIDVLSALEMSSDAPILATWPKSRSRLLWINWDSCGGEPARNQTVALATWSNWSMYGIRRIRRRQILFKQWSGLCILKNKSRKNAITSDSIVVTYSPPVILRKTPRMCANVGRWSAASFQQDLMSSTRGLPSSVVSGSWGRYGMLSPLRTRFTTSAVRATCWR